MIKKQLLSAVCAAVMAQSASAAYIESTVTNGNIVDDLGSEVVLVSLTPETYIGYSKFDVTFNNLQSVQIDFGNLYAAEDNVSMNIYNNTGVGWSGFDFTLVGVGFDDADVVLNTGAFPEFQYHEIDPATGLPSGITLAFDPLVEVGLSASGLIDTSFSSTYSLILTPTTVPVPAAVWLFGSGLLGLIGVARKRG